MPTQGKGNRCLVVEDEERDRLMFARIFGRAGLSGAVEFAQSLAEARALLADRRYGLIVLDNTLPDGKGADFVVELGRTKRMASVPVVIVSDWPSPFMYAKARSANVLDVLTKCQFNGDRLAGLMRRAGLGG